MTRSAPRSIDQCLKALRVELAGEDAALIQDAQRLSRHRGEGEGGDDDAARTS